LLLVLVPESVQKQQVSKLIIDCTGIYKFDTIVIESLFKINKILKLLGIQCVLTGLRPELAVETVRLGKELKDIYTFVNIKDALKFFGLNVFQ
jgi:rsbT co-antagonist protein RsbR